MVTYKASELVTAALKLADLENTSFPSAFENRMAINNAWERVYQKCIDLGCDFWLQSFDIEEGTSSLPSDFYQLDYVEDTKHNQIDRHQKGMDERNRYYWLIGDTIVLNRCPNGATVWYNPVPQTLEISGTGDVELEFPNTMLWTMLVYEVAKYYKVKQNADYSGIQDLYNTAWEQFYDMIKKDNNQNVVIKDVYEHTPIIGGQYLW